MSIATTKNSLAQLLNTVLQGNLATVFNYLALGTMVRQQLPTTLRRCNPVAGAAIVANPYIIAGQGVAEVVPAPSGGVISALGANLAGVQLPDDAKASYLLRAIAFAGTSATLGELTIDAPATALAFAYAGPAAGHVAVMPSGDIAANATDAWTSIDVIYVPEKQDVAEYTITVVAGTGVGVLPALVTTTPTGSYPVGVVMLMEAEILAGATTGKCAVIGPSGSVPTTTKQANLNFAKTQVQFRIADSVTSARVKLGIVSAVNQNAFLELVTPFGI
jgi:hypothetical protein